MCELSKRGTRTITSSLVGENHVLITLNAKVYEVV